MILNFLYSFHPINLFIIIFLLTLCYILIFKKIVKRFIHIEPYENSTISTLANFASTVYAIFMGFIVFVTIGNLRAAQDENNMEAKTIFEVYVRLSQVADSYSRTGQILLREYVYSVIENEWPAMKRGIYNAAGEKQIHALIDLLKNNKTTNYEETLIWNELFQNVINLDLLHLSRINFSENLKLGEAIWYSLIFMTLITLGVNCLFYSPKKRLYLTLVTCTTLISTIIIFLIFNMDHPYRGTFSIKPDNYKQLLIEMERTP